MKRTNTLDFEQTYTDVASAAEHCFVTFALAQSDEQFLVFDGMDESEENLFTLSHRRY